MQPPSPSPYQQPLLRLRFINYRDVTLNKERRWLVAGWLPRDGFAVMYGPPKSGKTFLAHDIALHVALGQEWRGHRVMAGPVIYGAFEGEGGASDRIVAHRVYNEIAPDVAVPFELLPVRIDFIHHHPALIAAIRQHLGSGIKPVLIVLDTLNRSMIGKENDENFGAYIAAADALRAAFSPCCVVVVHHSGVEASRPRGHTSLTAAVDVQIKVTNDSGIISATVELARDGRSGETVASNLVGVELGTDESGEPIRSCVLVPAGAAPKRSWPPSLHLFHDSTTAALLDHAFTHRVRGDGPAVKGVLKEHVIAEFDAHYTHTGNGNRRDAMRTAFNRALAKARKPHIGLIGFEHVADRGEIIWLLQEKPPQSAMADVMRGEPVHD